MRVFNIVKLLAVISLAIGITSCGDSDKKAAGAGAGTGAGAAAGGSAVNLGAAAGCAILAGSTVTNTGPTVITGGDVCLSPGSSVVGFPPGTVSGSIRVPPDPIPAQAQLDLTTAYNNLAGTPGGASLPGDITGLTSRPVFTRTQAPLVFCRRQDKSL